jgi:hypothetical protein
MSKKDKARSGLIEKEDSILVIVDMQERLFPVMAEKEILADQVMKLVRFAKIVGLPVIMTEQEKLGPTLPEIRGADIGSPVPRFQLLWLQPL